MQSGLSDSLGSGFGPLASYALAAIVVLALLLLVLFVGKRVLGGGSVGQTLRKGPRLAVLDVTAIDQRRKLVLVRRDDVEHLVLIGGQNDLLVEGNILRQSAALRAPDGRSPTQRVEPEAIAPAPMQASRIPPAPSAVRNRASTPTAQAASPLRRTVPRPEQPVAPVQPAPVSQPVPMPTAPPSPTIEPLAVRPPLAQPEPAAVAPDVLPPRETPSDRMPVDEPAVAVEPPALAVADRAPVGTGPLPRSDEPVLDIPAPEPVVSPKADAVVADKPADAQPRIPAFLRRTDFPRTPRAPEPEALPERTPDDAFLNAPRSERQAEPVLPPFPVLRQDRPQPVPVVPSLQPLPDPSASEPLRVEPTDAPSFEPKPEPRPVDMPAVRPAETVRGEDAKADREEAEPAPPPPVAIPARYMFPVRASVPREDKAAPIAAEPAAGDDNDRRPLSVRSFATAIQPRRTNFEVKRPEDQTSAPIARPAPPLVSPVHPTAPTQHDDAGSLDDELTRELDSGLGALDWADAPARPDPRAVPADDPIPAAAPLKAPEPPVLQPVPPEAASRAPLGPPPAAPPQAGTPAPAKTERPLTLEEEMERLLGDFDISNLRR